MLCTNNSNSVHNASDGSTNQGSKAVILGTHQDVENQCLESREQKNQKLQRLLYPQFDQSLVFCGGGGEGGGGGGER